VSLGAVLLASLAVVLALDATSSVRPVPTAPAPPVQPTSAPTLYAAGDIAGCEWTTDEQTGDVLEARTGAIAALGDTVYSNGTHAEYADCYEPAWGAVKARTRPAPGNHEYHTPGAAGYYGYFGAAAGDPSQGYYSYDVGTWHVVVLNSNCEVVSCAAGSPQDEWLRADLAATEAKCTLAYWHQPRFSSGFHGSHSAVAPFWDALYEHGAELVLGGHEHSYERFAPQRPDRAPDPAFGIRQFVVGTGGAPLRGPGATPAANSERFESSSHGVLELALGEGTYTWAFVPVPGSSLTDTGSGTCHGSPAPRTT
jgi:acid phosphatase type 7